MKKITLFAFAIYVTYFSFSQAPEIEWQNTIGGNAYDELYSVSQTSEAL